MTTAVGSIRGQIRIDAKQALAEYGAVRSANAQTRASLNSASSSFAKVGMGAIAAAAPIVLLFKKAVGAAADFQKKLDYFGAITNASGADMDKLAKKAMDMSKTTVYSAADMADAFVEFGKAGIATKDILGGVADATANLAQAADIAVTDAANIIVSTMSTFHMKAKDTAHIADQLSGAANASIIDISDIAYSLKYAGGIAAATKIPFENLVDAIAILGNAGIKGSTAGTSLRQIMVSLAGPTKAAAQQMSNLGLITAKGKNLFIDQKGHLKDLAQIFDLLRTHTAKLTDAERLAALKQIFNSRALASANILLKAGTKGFTDMEKQIQRGSAADVARKRLNNLSGDITHLKNTIQTTLIQIGGPVQKALRPFVQGLTHLIQLFGNLPAPVQKTIIMILLALAAFLLIFGSIALVIAAFLKIIVIFKDFKMALVLLRGGIGLVIGALRAMFMAMITNPIFLVIAALALLVVGFIYLWNHFKGFRDFWKNLWENIKKIAASVWHWMVQTWHDVVNGIKVAAQTVWRGIQDYLVKPVLTAWNAIVNAFKTAKDFIKKHWTSIILIIGLLLGPVGVVLALLIDLIHAHWNTIVKFAKATWAFITKIVSDAWDAIVTATKIVVGILVSIWQNLIAGAQATWGALTSFFSALFHGIATMFSNSWHAISSTVTGIWRALVAGVKMIFGPLVAFFRAIWTGVANVVEPLVHGIVTAVETVFRGLIGAVRAIWNGIVNAISTAAHAVWNVVSNIASGIKNVFVGAGTWLWDAGKALMEGLWNGIKSMASTVWDGVSNFAKSLWDKFTSFFGIFSPSRRMHWGGTMLVKGLEQGITKRKGFAVAAAVQMAKDVNDASQVQAKYSMMAQRSAVQVPQAVAPKASQINVGRPPAIHVHVDNDKGTSKAGTSIGRKVDIGQLHINNPAKEPASDSLYHTVQKILEGVI